MNGCITLSKPIVQIYGCFSGQTTLTDIRIPEGVLSCTYYTFSGCTSLTGITLPSTLVSIMPRMFMGCSSLREIIIPDNVTVIGYSAFYYCRSLTSINIPSGVTSIGNSAFSDCSGLTSITILAITPPTLGTKVFDNISSSPKIYVPSGSVDAYKTATNWSNYANIIQAIGT